MCRIVIQLVVFTTLSAALVEIAQVAVIAIALQASDCQEMFEFGFWILIGPIFEAIVSVVYSGCMFYVARKGVVTRNKNCECCSCCGPGYGPLRAFFQWAIVGAILAGIGGLWTTLSFAFGWSDDPNGIVTNFIYLGLLSLCAVFAQSCSPRSMIGFPHPAGPMARNSRPGPPSLGLLSRAIAARRH